MTGKVSSCGMCGQYFDSKAELKHHIDERHRITDAKVRKRQVLLTCKHCKKIFASLVGISARGEDLDRLVADRKELCPNCHQSASYSPDDYTLV